MRHKILFWQNWFSRFKSEIISFWIWTQHLIAVRWPITVQYVQCTVYSVNIEVFPSDPLAIMNADTESRSVGCFCLVQYRAVKKWLRLSGKKLSVKTSFSVWFTRSIALKVGTNENGSACGRWLSIGIYFALWWSTFIFFFDLAAMLE